MDDLTFRSIEPDELPAFMETLEHAFHGTHEEDELEQERLIAEPDRYFVALDDGRMVGTAGACTTRLTVPGGSVAAAGVTAVGVLPSHRRLGINTRLMATLLDQAAERGEPLAYLWASESPIYGRFGYGIASIVTELEMTTLRSGFVAGVEVSGNVRVLSRDEALPLMRPVYEAVAATRPGMMAIDERWWTWLFRERKQDEKKPLFFAVHENADGAPDGYAVYRVKHEWPHGVPSNTLEVQHLIAVTPAADAALWRFLLDIDLVSTVKAWDRPADEPLFRLVQEPRRLNLRTSDGLWLRLIDVEKALGARRFAAEGRVVFEIVDGFRPATSGRYELVVGGSELTCGRTDAEPDVACGVHALGAAYLGGTSFRQLERAQQVRQVSRGALARADAMFAWDPSPWFGFIF